MNETSPEWLSASDQAFLLRLARRSIEHGLRYGRPLEPEIPTDNPALRAPRAVFVTLHRFKELRGCIGTLEADEPLVRNVAIYSYHAAFSDTRFEPLTWEELPDVEIQISILSPLEELRFASEEDLLRQIRPGIDGLLLEDDEYRGTFLPSVWESLPDKHEFLRKLKRKAGLSEDHWSDTLRVWRYTTFCFSGRGDD